MQDALKLSNDIGGVEASAPLGDSGSHAEMRRDGRDTQNGQPSSERAGTPEVRENSGSSAPPDVAFFLHWIADRLVHVYGESERVDFILRLRTIADFHKPTGDQPTTKEGEYQRYESIRTDEDSRDVRMEGDEVFTSRGVWMPITEELGRKYALLNGCAYRRPLNLPTNNQETEAVACPTTTSSPVSNAAGRSDPDTAAGPKICGYCDTPLDENEDCPEFEKHKEASARSILPKWFCDKVFKKSSKDTDLGDGDLATQLIKLGEERQGIRSSNEWVGTAGDELEKKLDQAACEPGWRWLGPNELLAEGDEHYSGDNWYKTSYPGFKQVPHLRYRRRITPTEPARLPSDEEIKSKNGFQSSVIDDPDTRYANECGFRSGAVWVRGYAQRAIVQADAEIARLEEEIARLKSETSK